MSLLQRFKFLALPFLMWAGIGVASVLFLRWFLEYFTEIVHINQSIWNYWIPFIFAVLIWFIVLRRRFKLFFNPKWNNNQETLIFLGVNVCLGLTIMFSEFVMEYAYLKKQNISHISEINVADWNTCYELEDAVWDTNFIHAYNLSEVSGKHNQTLNYYAYFVAPLSKISKMDLDWKGIPYFIFKPRKQ